MSSTFGSNETMGRLEQEVRARGLAIFARIDHAAGAAEAGLSLRPTSVIIFGNARGGTPMMQAAQTAGIDLPLKVLIWEDVAGKTRLSYNEPSWIARRHQIAENDPTVAKLSLVLRAICESAASSQRTGGR